MWGTISGLLHKRRQTTHTIHLHTRATQRKSIVYLSADTDLDLDGNGLSDDVDADATIGNLQKAVTWASDADDVVLYLVDHGGNGNVPHERYRSPERSRPQYRA